MLLPIPSDFPLFQYTMEQAYQTIPTMEKEQIMDIGYHELKRDFKGKNTGVSKKSIEQE
jgi:hypothetical protein